MKTTRFLDQVQSDTFSENAAVDIEVENDVENEVSDQLSLGGDVEDIQVSQQHYHGYEINEDNALEAEIFAHFGWDAQSDDGDKNQLHFGRVLVLVDIQLISKGGTNFNISLTERPATKVPVNKFGFPPGFGRTEDERSGPYLYVACAIKSVQRTSTASSLTSRSSSERSDLITIERCDTEIVYTLRSNKGLHVLKNGLAIRVAIAAARQGSVDPSSNERYSRKSFSRQQTLKHMKATWWKNVKQFMTGSVVPFIGRSIALTKVLFTTLMRGMRPFSCKIRITGINLLVLCSTLFLFLQIVQLGWGSPEMDGNVAIIGLVVWCVLVLELIVEVMIRPSNYRDLIRSKKAYRPSTARYISAGFLFGEILALVLYLPEVICLNNTTDACLTDGIFGRFMLVKASAFAVIGPTILDSILGRLMMGTVSLRLFGVVRHWQHMLIQQTFHPTQRQGIEKWIIPYDPSNYSRKQLRRRIRIEKQGDDDTVESNIDESGVDPWESKENRRLKSAANIGTALIVVNCQRALILIVITLMVLPLCFSISKNPLAYQLTTFLQAQNQQANNIYITDVERCEYLEGAIDSWLNMAIVYPHGYSNDTVKDTYILWAQVLPVRCPFQNSDGKITSCTGKQSRFKFDYPYTCEVWDSLEVPKYTENQAIQNAFARNLSIRGDGIFVEREPIISNPTNFSRPLNVFEVTVVVNNNPTIANANKHQFITLALVYFVFMFFLLQLQYDIYKLALHPIQRMLRIVVRYAENPLSSDIDNDKEMAAKKGQNDDDSIGDLETEQLLNAITKISDLLRKCWGVAGAGIISANLARGKDGQVAGFNPLVPGKQVYALFGFVGICGFKELLRTVDRDIMILINDVAKVVHDEVYRWGFGDHGQCNKNLGQAFLMVWRIGDFSEVQKKNKAAIEKMFRDKVYKTSKNNTNLRRRARTGYTNKTTTITTVKSISMAGRRSRQDVQLESLPGIQTFADRALLGMLKSFAGIHRDRNLQRWRNDSRLRMTSGYSNETSCYTIDIIYGMDAGWAMEGAVGSVYKIDATYLSPHVNMASRMMSASKQYGATILLSKDVEKILSKPCRNKLRHLDTVHVKGSAINQAIYTYDARHAGVDFFLIERTPEQADYESDSYTPSIWDNDPDIVSMRRHITEDFLETYQRGLNQYLEGRWTEAFQCFEKADDIMIRTVLEEGYIEITDDELLDALEKRILDKTDNGEDVVKLRNEFGDGACRTLMDYIESNNFQAPVDWNGVRKLVNK